MWQQTGIALAALLLSFASSVQAECALDPPAPITAAVRSASLKSTLLTTGFVTAAQQTACRRDSTGLRAFIPSGIGKSGFGRSPAVIDSATVVNAAERGMFEHDSPLAPQMDVHWRSVAGPAWVQSVPQWVTDNARNYHRRGLPVLHLWESSNYLVALGLSNHGVPGLYFSQKLP
jgi:hypothetical protein